MEKILGIVTGGKYSNLLNIDKCDFIIACDKGLEYLMDNNINPDLVIGDFDSFNGLIDKSINMIKLPIEKDDTDLFHAYRYAVEHGFNKIKLYCALGNRLDHMLGNLDCAIFGALNGIYTEIIDEDNNLYIFKDNSVKICPIKDFSLSFVTLTDKATISISGAKYTLNNYESTNHYPIGISNEWDGECEIKAKDGVIAVINSRKI